jgi:hypothetical protein
MKTTFLFLFVISQSLAQQNELPYRQIPTYPARYTAATVSARMIDGLGFRYYWATEGLQENDLSYSPNGEARTTLETITHIYELSTVILNSVKQIPNIPDAAHVLSFQELRQKTLENLKATSDQLLISKDKDLTKFKLIFKRESGTRELPFWNQINGPIADALWHVGQVVSFRRSSGNPFNGKANVLLGKLME